MTEPRTRRGARTALSTRWETWSLGRRHARAARAAWTWGKSMQGRSVCLKRERRRNRQDLCSKLKTEERLTRWQTGRRRFVRIRAGGVRLGAVRRRAIPTEERLASV